MSAADGLTADDGILLPYQRRWLEDRSQVKIIEKSRRIGITWAEACDAVLCACASNGQDVWYMSYNADMTQEFVAACADWAKALARALPEAGACSDVEEEMIRDEDEDVRTYVIRFASGHRITGLPSRPTTLRGRQGRAVIDEAAFIRPTSGAGAGASGDRGRKLREVIKAALAFLILGGEARIMSTHDGAENVFAELVNDTRAGRRPWSAHRVTIDDAVADGLYRRVVLPRTNARGAEPAVWTAEGERAWLQGVLDTYGEDADEELRCIPAHGSDRYFARALIERRMDLSLPVLRFRQKPEFKMADERSRRATTEEWIRTELDPQIEAAKRRWQTFSRQHVYLSQDFARSADLSSIFVAAETDRLGLDAAVAVEMRDIPFVEQFYVVDYLMTACGVRNGAVDARGNGQMIAEMLAQKHRGRVQEVMITRATYLEEMPRYRSLYEDGLIVVPQSAGILDDHANVREVGGVPTIVARTRDDDDGGQRHGDTAVSGMLLSYAQHHDEGPPQEMTYDPVDVTGRNRWLGLDAGGGYDDIDEAEDMRGWRTISA